MPTTTSLLVFAGAALMLLVVPGPAVTYIVVRSASQGTRAGLVSVAGIHTGTLVHVAAAVAGLSALLATSATAFTIVKLAGAAWLVYLGVRTMVAPAVHDRPVEQVSDRSTRRLFLDGLVVNVLNPKTALFFLAFMPQFVDPAGGAATTQVVVLGALFVLLGLATDGCYAAGAAWLAARVRRRGGRRRTGRTGQYLVGGIYVALGVTAAAGGPPTE